MIRWRSWSKGIIERAESITVLCRIPAISLFFSKLPVSELLFFECHLHLFQEHCPKIVFFHLCFICKKSEAKKWLHMVSVRQQKQKKPKFFISVNNDCIELNEMARKLLLSDYVIKSLLRTPGFVVDQLSFHPKSALWCRSWETSVYAHFQMFLNRFFELLQNYAFMFSFLSTPLTSFWTI